MPSKLQIQRLIPENDPHTRAYFSRTQLTNKPAIAWRGTKEARRDPVLALVLEIPGVANAAVTAYSLSVLKAPTWEWEEIEPSILRLMTAFNLGEGVLESEKEGN
jgi:hypothetical protein